MIKEILGMLRERGANIDAIAGTGTTVSAATSMEMTPPPKAQTTKIVPTFLTSTQQSPDTFLPQNDLFLANLDIDTLRGGATTAATLRSLVKASPDLSAAVFSAIRVGVTAKYTVIARNLDGTLNPDGTALAQQLCRRFDILGPSDGGYNAWPSIRSASETMAKELMLLGACSLEVVLNKARLPEALLPIAVDSVRFKYQKKRKIPFQVVGGEEISLDYPTFFYLSLDQSTKFASADSPVESSIQPMIAIQSFMSDLRRVFRRAIHPRIKAMLNEEKWRKMIPADILNDPQKLKDYMDTTTSSIQTLINGLNPEDALVLFDILDIDYLNNGSISLSEEYKTLAAIMNSKLAAGSKTLPTILGHEAQGSRNIASTQAMLYLRTVEGAVQFKINEIFSRALTLCVRLFGVDAVVEFAYDRPNLRPEAELEAFYAMKQSRVREQLSDGLITDEEASLLLTGTLPPAGMRPLSGTGFAGGGGGATNISTPESNTSALNQDLSGDAPRDQKTT